MYSFAKKLKKPLLSVLGLTLVAVLTVAGTLAYLQDESEEIVNTFKANGITVDIVETVPEGGRWEIIPGTTQTKDPTVKVTATCDAFVYVTVTDKTNGLVGYKIDMSKWTLLEGTENVYWIEVAGNDAEQSFQLLEGNTVSYDAALTNDDMTKSTVTLTFQAYAIQKEPFGTAKNAYYMKGATPAAEPEELKTALTKANAVITLTDDLAYSSTGDISKAYKAGKTATLNLPEGKTITYSAAEGAADFMAIYVSGGRANLTVNGDGTIDASQGAFCFDLYGANALQNPKLTINGGKYYASTTAVQVERGTAYITGGFFDCGGSEYTLNCIDKNYKKGADIVVTGGTFVNFDPSNCAAEGEGTNFVAKGYTVVSELQENGDTWYTVVKDTTNP